MLLAAPVFPALMLILPPAPESPVLTDIAISPEAPPVAAEVDIVIDPDVPALVVQAEHDETLGTEHFALIQEHMAENSEIHVLDMPHTSTVETDERRSTVETWMEQQLGYNRSVS